MGKDKNTYQLIDKDMKPSARIVTIATDPKIVNTSPESDIVIAILQYLDEEYEKKDSLEEQLKELQKNNNEF